MRHNPVVDNATQKVLQGEQIFRFDTFGDEAFWGDTLKLHQAIEGAKLGGVGPGVSPKTALAVGLKVDLDALPRNLTGTNISGASLIPPAFGLGGVNLHTWIGWGSVPHWNAFVANLEMHGKGRFFDPRLNNAAQFPSRLGYEFSGRSCAPCFGVQSVACPVPRNSSTLAKWHRPCGGVAPCAGVAVVRNWSGRYLTDAKTGGDVS